jgi:hypothetical protein
VNHDDQTITLLVEDGIHSLYEIKNRIIRELRARFDCLSRGGEAPQDGGAEKV